MDEQPVVKVPRRTETPLKRSRARPVRREEGEYLEYLSDEHRRGAGGIGGRMQWGFHHGLLAFRAGSGGYGTIDDSRAE